MRAIAVAVMLVVLGGCSTSARWKTDLEVKPGVTCVVKPVRLSSDTREYLRRTLVDDKGRRRPEVPASVETDFRKIADQQARISAACRSAAQGK
jgi:hypothetical protein